MRHSTEVNCSCAIFACTCMVLIVTFSTIMGVGISEYSGGDHLVTTEPKYDDAVHQAGYFDAAGVYQGGLPRWHDWTEGSSTCQEVSANGTYCQEWSMERYYSDAVQEFLKGNCTCDLTAKTDRSRSFYHWLDYNLSSEEFDSLDKASFCTAWSCEETRFKEACECDKYETQTTCTRRRLLATGSGGSRSSGSRSGSGSSSGTSCSTHESCVSYICKYDETPYYTACNCDHGGKKRLKHGPYWFNDSPFCHDWTCYQGHNRYSYDEEGEREETGGGDGEDDEDEDEEDKDEENEDEEDEDGDGIHDSKRSFWHSVARTYPTSRGASRKPKWIIVADTELSYICSEVDESGKWCAEWRGVSPEHGDYVEQLCECFNGTTIADSSEGFCQEWGCTSYYMEECNLCNTVSGILLGTLILLCMLPLVTGGCLGYHCQAFISIPCGLAAAALLAAFIGGIPAIHEGIIAVAIMVFILGGVLSMIVPKMDKTTTVPAAAPTAVLPTPDPNQPIINYGQTRPLSQIHVQSQQQQQQQQAVYPVPPALGGMQPAAVTYPGTVYSRPGSPVGFSSSYGSGPAAVVPTASAPVGYQSHPSDFERVASYGTVPGTSGQPSYYTGPGGNPSPQLRQDPGGLPPNQGLGGPPPLEYMGGPPPQHGVGGPPPNYGFGTSPPHHGFGAGTPQYLPGVSPPQHGYGSPPTHYGPGGL